MVTTLSGQFAAHGYEVYIATEWTGEDEYETDPRVRRVHVGLDVQQEKHNRLRRFADRILNLRRFLRKVQPDLVIAFARKANYRALTATLGMKLPVLISVRIHPVGYYDFLSDKIQDTALVSKGGGLCVPDEGCAGIFWRKASKKIPDYMESYR